jgi:hypothetical protein
MMKLLWDRYPEGCKFGGIPPPLGERLGRPVEYLLFPRVEHAPSVYVDGLGERQGHVLKSPDPSDVKSRRVSLDLANTEANREGIERFVKMWGKPRLFLFEDQFYEDRKVIRSVLDRQLQWAAVEDHTTLTDDWFRSEEIKITRHRGSFIEPLDLFQFAVREAHALLEHGVIKQVRTCNGCKRYYIAHKNTANRGGKQQPQRFCSDCGSKARSRVRRQRMKLVGARGPTGVKVSADPRHGRPLR